MSSDTAATLPPLKGPVDHHAKDSFGKLAVGAIGVVFGDIGTSPLYAFKETFVGHHPLAVDQLHIFGVVSLIFWSLMLIVTLKYVTIIMRADNRGEGGSLALLALISRLSPGGQALALSGHPRRAGDGAVLWRLHHHAGDDGDVGGGGPDRCRRQP